MTSNISAPYTTYIGGVGDQEHDKWISVIDQVSENYRQALTPRFQQVVEFWRLYFNQRVDKRSATEQWRAFMRKPTAYQIIETLVAVNVDLLTSPDPMIQAEGVGTEDDRSARAVERHLDYTLRRNKFQITMECAQRAKRVQGIDFLKTYWSERGVVTTAPRRSDKDFQKELDDFQQAVANGERMTGVKAPDGGNAFDVELFEDWRAMVSEKTNGEVSVPSPPTQEPTSCAMFKGPKIVRPNLFMMRFDPMIDNIEDQPYFMHRVVKPLKDVMKLADDDENSDCPYSLAQLNACKGGGKNDDNFRNWSKELATITGLSLDESLYNKPEDNIEVTEVWTADGDLPLLVLGNRKAVINKHPNLHPFSHGMKPFTKMVNVPIEGQLMGMSELAPSSDLFSEINKMAELRHDAAVLAVLPIFTRLTTGGLDMAQLGKLAPGDVIDVRRADALQMLSKSNPGILDAFREMGALRDDIDDTHATWSNVRGAGATIGRVSATDSVNRMNQALVRQKIHAQRDEIELGDMCVQLCGLWYQFGDSTIEKNIGGDNPWVTIPRERFYDAMFEDFKFRGATKILNRDQLVQNLITAAKTFDAILDAKEKRTILKEVINAMGIKNVGGIVSEGGTASIVQAEQAAKMMAAQPPIPGPGGPPMPGGGAPPPGPLGVNPAPNNQGQNLPLALLEAHAQGAKFSDLNPKAPS